MRTLAIVLVVAACGGGSGGGLGNFGTGPLTAAQAAEICEVDCQHDIECGSGQSLEACVASCTNDLVGWARGDAVQDVIECAVELACGVGDDICFAEIEPLPVHQEWEDACRATLVECLEPDAVEGLCESDPDPSSDVGFISLIIEPIVEEMIDCTAAAVCQVRLDCIEMVADANNIDF